MDAYKIKNKISICVISSTEVGKTSTIDRLFAVTTPSKTSKNLIETTFKPKFYYEVHKEKDTKPIETRSNFLSLKTNNFNVTLIDTPCNLWSFKNMIRAIHTADAAILVISSVEGEDYAFKVNPRKLLLLAKLAGVSQIIMAINKMDLTKYSEARFNEVSDEFTEVLKEMGFNFSILPISSLDGPNILYKYEQLKWWKGQTLFESIDNLKAPLRNYDKPFRMTVMDVFKVSGVGTVVTGKIAAGVLKTEMEIKFSSLDKIYKCRSIETHREMIENGFAGDVVGFVCMGISHKDIKRGWLVGDSNNSPPVEVESFVAKVKVMKKNGFMKANYTPVVVCHTAYVSCRISKLISKLDPETGKVIEENPIEGKKNDCILMELVPIKALCVETYEDFESLGMFYMTDMKEIVASGIVKSVSRKEVDFPKSVKLK